MHSNCDQLPREILVQIFQYFIFDLPQLAKCSQVSKRWQTISQSDDLWRVIADQLHISAPPSGQAWFHYLSQFKLSTTSQSVLKKFRCTINAEQLTIISLLCEDSISIPGIFWKLKTHIGHHDIIDFARDKNGESLLSKYTKQKLEKDLRELHSKGKPLLKLFCSENNSKIYTSIMSSTAWLFMWNAFREQDQLMDMLVKEDDNFWGDKTNPNYENITPLIEQLVSFSSDKISRDAYELLATLLKLKNELFPSCSTKALINRIHSEMFWTFAYVAILFASFKIKKAGVQVSTSVGGDPNRALALSQVFKDLCLPGYGRPETEIYKKMMNLFTEVFDIAENYQDFKKYPLSTDRTVLGPQFFLPLKDIMQSTHFQYRLFLECQKSNKFQFDVLNSHCKMFFPNFFEKMHWKVPTCIQFTLTDFHLNIAAILGKKTMKFTLGSAVWEGPVDTAKPVVVKFDITSQQVSNKLNIEFKHFLVNCCAEFYILKLASLQKLPQKPTSRKINFKDSGNALIVWELL